MTPAEPIDPDLEADLKAAREILARIRAGEPTIPWEQVKAELGLDDLSMRLVPMTEAVARHLLDVLVVPWQASWEASGYDWDRHREVIILVRKHWPDLFAAHEAAAWVEASYEQYPPIDEVKHPDEE